MEPLYSHFTSTSCHCSLGSRQKNWIHSVMERGIDHLDIKVSNCPKSAKLRNRNHKSLTDSGGAAKLFGTGASVFTFHVNFLQVLLVAGQAQKFFWLVAHHKSWRDISAVKGLPVLLKNLPLPIGHCACPCKKVI